MGVSRSSEFELSSNFLLFSIFPGLTFDILLVVSCFFRALHILFETKTLLKLSQLRSLIFNLFARVFMFLSSFLQSLVFQEIRSKVKML